MLERGLHSRLVEYEVTVLYANFDEEGRLLIGPKYRPYLTTAESIVQALREGFAISEIRLLPGKGCVSRMPSREDLESGTLPVVTIDSMADGIAEGRGYLLIGRSRSRPPYQAVEASFQIVLSIMEEF